MTPMPMKIRNLQKFESNFPTLLDIEESKRKCFSIFIDANISGIINAVFSIYLQEY